MGRIFIDTAAVRSACHQSNLQFDGADDNNVSQQQGFESQVNASKAYMQTLASQAQDIKMMFPEEVRNNLKRYDDYTVNSVCRLTTELLSGYSVLKQEEDNFTDANYSDRISVLAARRLITWSNILRQRLQTEFAVNQNAQRFTGIYEALQQTVEGLRTLFKDNFPRVYAFALDRYSRGSHGADTEDMGM